MFLPDTEQLRITITQNEKIQKHILFEIRLKCRPIIGDIMSLSIVKRNSLITFSHTLKVQG
jgi:hypothetical protein